MSNISDTAAMHQRSGQVVLDSKLVSFLYLLMRDHLPAGFVEKLVQESDSSSESRYTNGWLAKYAEDIASRLQK